MRLAALTMAATLAVLALNACAGPGTHRGTTRQTDVRVADQVDDNAAYATIRTESSVSSFLVDAPADRVWNAVQNVWAELEFPASVYEVEERRIGHEGFRVTRIAGERMAQWLDCGQGMTGPNANRFDTVLTLFIDVFPQSASSSEVVMDMDGQGKPRDYSSNWMHCGSTGRLERLIMERVGIRLTAPGQD